MSHFEDLVKGSNSASALSTYLTLHPTLSRYDRFRQYILFHKEGRLPALLQQKARETSAKLRSVSDEMPAFRLTEMVGRKDKNEVSGTLVILPGSQANFYRLITISRSDFWTIVSRLVRELYPEAMPVFFKQKETKEALLALEMAMGASYRIVIRDVVMKRKMSDESARESSRIETDRLWTKLSIQEAYDQALEGNYWFTSIGFDVEREKERTNRYIRAAKGRIYKNGAINYNFLHQEIDRSTVKVLEKHAAERLRFLSGRGIRERNYRPSAPLQITYGRDFFSDRQEVKRFGNVIADYPKSTRAVFHSNPYYHASVADFVDGSSFELWILSPQRILITPQAKCTEQALERLISYIFSEYNEGELSEYRKSE